MNTLTFLTIWPNFRESFEKIFHYVKKEVLMNNFQRVINFAVSLYFSMNFLKNFEKFSEIPEDLEILGPE